jgi:hypothetical protein
MSLLRRPKIRAYAPAVVVLATVVNAAASEHVFASPQSSTPDLSWVVNGGATHSKATRISLAKKAATQIHSLDRISGAQPSDSDLALVELPAITRAPLVATNETPQDHTQSSHQHSAP